MVLNSDPTNFGNKPGDGPLRPNGEAQNGLPMTESNLPSTPSPAVKRMSRALEVVRDLAGGQEKVHDRGQAYLPKEPGEDSGAYASRLRRSAFFNVFSHTIDGLTGFVFRKDPVLGDDVSTLIRGTETQPGHWENIDLAGTHGDVFTRELFGDALEAGHAAILVDFPDTGGSQSHADEHKGDFPIRPYWVPIKKDDILSWRTTTINGRLVLTQIVIRERVTVMEGLFGEKEKDRYRVLYREPTGAIKVKVLEITEDKRIVVVSEGEYPTQVEIPVAEIPTSGSKSLFVSNPPLVDLAFLNIAHYQMWSDYANSIHKTNVPIFFLAGVQQDTNEDGTPKGGPLVLGPNTAITAPDANAKAEYVSHDGQALGSSKTALDDLKADMATLGIAMLSSQKRTAETAEAKRIDKSAADSALGVTARGLQDGIERALGFHARYLKVPDGGSIQINRDFENLVMDAQVMQAYATLGEKLGVPLRVILKELQAGGRIGEDEDVDALAEEMSAEMAAEADRQAQADAEALALNKQKNSA